MFTDKVLRQPAPLDPRVLTGTYAFYDDGWPATLTLRVGADHRIDAEFFSYDRTRGAFTATAELDPEQQHHLTVVVHDFNELPEQRYEGYIFTRRRVAVAGVSDWKGQTFSFFACRQPPYTLGPLLPGDVSPQDLLGTYGLYCDGVHATLNISTSPSGLLGGSLRESDSGREFPVRADVDPLVPHRAFVTIEGVPGEGPAPVLTVLMFVQRRTALAGWLDWGTTRLGCYLIRYLGADPSS
jgi:hypothetical protein